MITTVKPERTRALQLTIDSNLPDQTRSVQTGELKEENFQVEPMWGMEKKPLAGRTIFLPHGTNVDLIIRQLQGICVEQSTPASIF